MLYDVFVYVLYLFVLYFVIFWVGVLIEVSIGFAGIIANEVTMIN